MIVWYPQDNMNSRQFFSSVFRLGVRQKVMLILLTVLLTALTISGWMAFNQEKENTLKEINQRGSDISRFVAKSLAFSVVGYDYHTIQLLLDEITMSDDIGYARVLSKKGNVMAESGEEKPENNPTLVLFKQDINLDTDTVGKLVLGLSTEHTIARLETQKFSLLKREAFIILMIAIGEFLALSFIIVRPVSVMSRSLNNNVDENGRIIGELPVISNDEFGQLAELFNSLSSELNNANDRLQSKVQSADKQLIETNKQLVNQSEELKRISENLKKMSITDELTGLYNRRRFEELMQSEIELSQRHGDISSILIMDIDHFKVINDTHGHPCGDSVLKDIADLLKSKLRKTDILCRIGGEEFVVLCKRANRKEAEDIAEHLRLTIEQTTLHYGKKDIQLTVSIGIATITGKSTDRDRQNMYRYADKALYHSKGAGRNLVTHYDNINSTYI